MSTLLRDLHARLREDVWRKDPANAFSAEIKAVHDVLFYPFATRKNMEKVIAEWLQGFQPCLFGKIAAAKDRMHYCLITKEDILEKSDAEIASQIRESWLAWQRRSLRPTPDFSKPAHGFILLVISDKVTLAAPDDNLKAFSNKVLELLGSRGSDNPQGTVHSETLCLWHPVEHTYTLFTFSVDYFAVQGDGRWWHDHRIPGGIALTANSVGHMRRFREWYSELPGQDEWVLKTAMETIHRSAKTKYGRATWLNRLPATGLPLVKEHKCPFSNPAKLKPVLRDKDWTRYSGFLHTDHSIRDEFFHDEPEMIKEIAERYYLEDFTYLYDPKAEDHSLFVAGKSISEAEVFAAIGDIASWVSVYGSERSYAIEDEDSQIISSSTDDSEIADEELKRLMGVCAQWALTEYEISQLSEMGL